MENARVIRAVLADDHAIVRSGLRNTLLGIKDINVVGEAEDGESLIAILKKEDPNLLVVDVSMPNFDPIEGIKQIKRDYPNIRILVVSAYADEMYVTGLLGVGVDGYHLKDQPLADLHLAVQRVLQGERWISSPLVERLVKIQNVASPTHISSKLTRRQRELLRLLTQGFDNRRIAHVMDLSVKTIENHLTGLYRVLGVDSRLAATNYANQHPELTALADFDTHVKTQEKGNALSVLVVDDNARYRQQLARLIGKTCLSATLYEAEDTADALRIAKQVHPNLVFVDVVLPEEDGIQCVRKIKASVSSARLVLMSAYPDREFRRLGMNAGAIAFLDKKDIDAATVRQVVVDALGAI
jgi:DNA-binding NarL/FixJ family response regulator